MPFINNKVSSFFSFLFKKSYVIKSRNLGESIFSRCSYWRMEKWEMTSFFMRQIQQDRKEQTSILSMPFCQYSHTNQLQFLLLVRTLLLFFLQFNFSVLGGEQKVTFEKSMHFISCSLQHYIIVKSQGILQW